MVANLDNMTNAFNIYNETYFGGILPCPLFAVLHSYRICGCFTWSDMTWEGEPVCPTIKVTDYYDLEEEDFRNIMCHEMLHYYLMHLHIDMKGTHGKWFKKKAAQLNEKFGLNITVRTYVSDLKRRKGAPILGYWLRHLYF